jgi:hypothetical protein
LRVICTACCLLPHDQLHTHSDRFDCHRANRYTSAATQKLTGRYVPKRSSCKPIAG